ncbi:MAG TPA: HD domain-containing protein [Cytophagaceae bacterium]|jgi:HD superfamily phosphohydrolase|nr:HD domain-containing protein [Cytophagaceae bacterium]
MSKKKIINDPVYGFIEINSGLIFDLIEHPYFQRLRRIKQLGLTDLVYPGALHTRFHHALGAMHLMDQALASLAGKGVTISEKEIEAAKIAILLHDVGHSPFSHALEHSILVNVRHEAISELVMEKLNKELGGKLQMAIQMFKNHYSRRFFHQLISSQLDMDRLDYLNRDCFFTGVHEGTIGAERIIKMLNVANDELVIDQKGIYSVENFLTARRLMYWQVYLHKTTICAEKMTIQIIHRVRHLLKKKVTVPCPDSLSYFLSKELKANDFSNRKEALSHFMNLDDHDIWFSIKQWGNHSDKVLSTLCKMLVTRKLFSIQLSSQVPPKADILKAKKATLASLGIKEADLKYFILTGTVSNEAYIHNRHKEIKILTKNKKLVNLIEASDLPNIKALGKIVKKHYLCFPKIVSL